MVPIATFDFYYLNLLIEKTKPYFLLLNKLVDRSPDPENRGL